MKNPQLHSIRPETGSRLRQRGAAMVETFVIFGAFILVVLSAVQAGMFFYARSNLTYAGHAAARAGAVDHASISSITQAYQRAMFGYYGGGRDLSEQGETLKFIAKHPEVAAMKIEILSPTQEAFEDYGSEALKAQYKTSEPVLPNVALDQLSCPRDRTDCKSDPHTNKSGMSLQDANLLRVRITYGIPPVKQVPLIGPLTVWVVKYFQTPADGAYKAGLLAAGALPVSTTVTLRMQSDPIRNSLMASSEGKGNEGSPKDPGPRPPFPAASAPPTCGIGDPMCKDRSADAKNPCPDGVTLMESAQSEVLFDFDSRTLNDAGKATLDKLIDEAKARNFDSLDISGYTDPLGPDAYNLKLSQDRANAVRDYLQSHGFPTKPVTATGKGETEEWKKLADCPSSPAAAQQKCLAPDRRVMFKFNNLR